MNPFRIALLLVLGSTLVAATGSAQDEAAGEEPATMFYDFNDMLIDGELLKPDGIVATERGGAVFGRLVALRRSFIPEIEQAAHEDSLQ